MNNTPLIVALCRCDVARGRNTFLESSATTRRGRETNDTNKAQFEAEQFQRDFSRFAPLATNLITRLEATLICVKTLGRNI